MQQKYTLVCVAAAALGALLAWNDARAQQRGHNQVPCWAVPNGLNATILCANGYYRTITPEGVEIVGNGINDPSASATGGTFTINPVTGGPNIDHRRPILQPAQQPLSVAPGEAEMYGGTVRWD